MITICPHCKGIIGNNDVHCPRCGINILDFLEAANFNQTLQNTLTNNSISSANDTPQQDYTSDAPQVSPNSITTFGELEQLEIDTGILTAKSCSNAKNDRFAEMLANGQPLPPNIAQSKYTDNSGHLTFLRIHRKIPEEKEELYILMKIYQDLHFIKTLLKILLILSIIAGVIIGIVSGTQ